MLRFKTLPQPLLYTTALVAAGVLGASLTWAQTKVWTTKELFNRNIGTKEQQTKQFPPHKIVGNIADILWGLNRSVRS